MIQRNVALQVDNLKINGRLYLPGELKQTGYPAVCVCHGIPSGRTADPSDGGYPLLAEKICSEGFAVFIFNFRGTGTSEGNLDMLGWTRDLKTVINYLCSLPEIDKERLSLVGFSGGAAVSVYVASSDARISCVIACACPAEFKFGNPLSLIEHFRNIGTIRDEVFPYSEEEWINGFREISPISHVARIAPRSLLLVHGNGDETIDISQTYRLYTNAGEPRQMIVVDGADHKLRRNDRAMGIVIDWLRSWTSS